jgi:hypothetical protein
MFKKIVSVFLHYPYSSVSGFVSKKSKGFSGFSPRSVPHYVIGWLASIYGRGF